MITSRVNLVAVGGFVLLMLVTLVVALAVLAGRTGDTDAYYTIYPNVAGLKFGTQVTYEGYPIGQVDEVLPEPGAGGMQFRIALSVIEGWRIPRDSTASIAVTGLLSPASIAIRAGESPEALAPGDMITPGGGGSGLFEAVGGIGEKFGELSGEGLLPLLRNIDAQVSRVGRFLDGDVATALAHVTSITAQLDAAAPTLIADLQQTTASLAAAGTQLEQVLTPARLQQLDVLLADVASASRSLNSMSGRLDRLIDDGGADVGSAAADLRQAMAALNGRAAALAHNLEAASRDLAEFSRQVREDPSRVLRRTKPPAEPRP